MSRPLIALMLCTFCIGTAESVIAGILPPIAHDTGTSLRAVGMLVTIYALIVVVTGPLVTALCSRLARRTVLASCMGIFAAGNLICTLSSGYGSLVTGRAISALAHSTVIAVAVAAARDLAPAHRKAHASAQVTLGIGLATVIGVPMGTAIGEQWGWRTTFASLTALSGLCLALLTSSNLPQAAQDEVLPAHTGRKPQPSLSIPPAMLTTTMVIILGTGGIFAFYTYAVAFFTRETGLTTTVTTLLLLLYGLGGIAGNHLGARMADRNHQCAALVALAAGTTGLLLLTAARHTALLIPPLLIVVGLAYFATIPALNTQIVAAARTTDPATALAVNNSAFCTGIALGSWLGGTLIAQQPLAVLPLAAAALTSLALCLQGAHTWTTRRVTLSLISPSTTHGSVPPETQARAQGTPVTPPPADFTTVTDRN
ncbi:MFS transporter [Streptomyces sp. NPDC006184]|uniref:MFS transporter n=1 Tax=Streptomyces sp. NPDC006184 TaxID=3155455 RepID=UPI0033A95E7C